MIARHLLLLLSVVCPVVSGCAGFVRQDQRAYETIRGQSGSTQQSRSLNNQALEQLRDCSIADAERLVNDALVADPDFGPAHNTLGKIYYQQRQYYLAAWEFEYAQRLMPDRLEPVNNLGLVYEAVGQYDRAIELYQQAVSGAEDTPEYLGNLIRARISRGDSPFSMQGDIRHLLLIDSRPNWVNWAKLKLLSDGTEQRLLRESSNLFDDDSEDTSFDSFDDEDDSPRDENLPQLPNSQPPNDFVQPQVDRGLLEPPQTPPFEDLPNPADALDATNSPVDDGSFVPFEDVAPASDFNLPN